MRSHYKPNPHTSVAPYLVVDDAARTIEFLVRTFDAIDLRRFPGEAGKIMHADVRIDDGKHSYVFDYALAGAP